MPQFPYDLPSFNVLDCDSFFPNKLMYFIHMPTKVAFLADTGSVVDIVTQEILIKHFPEYDAQKIPYRIPFRGIGGKAQITHFVFLPLGRHRNIPFCTGPGMPMNIIGLHWLETVNDLLDIETLYANSRSLRKEPRERGTQLQNPLTLMNISAHIIPPLDMKNDFVDGFPTPEAVTTPTFTHPEEITAVDAGLITQLGALVVQN